MIKILKSRNKLKLAIFLFAFSLSFALAINQADAAVISFSVNNNTPQVGDTVRVDVLMDTEGASLNVVEGNVLMSSFDSISIKELSVSNSNLNYWVRNPSWSEKEGIISFIGGAPGGFKQSKALLFHVYFTALKSGQVQISSGQVKAYLNDGKASAARVSFLPLNVVIKEKTDVATKDEWKGTLTRDLTAPSGIMVDLGQDPSLFDGQKFLNISAIDAESGIDHFEVREGNRSPVRTTGNYVLQNQENLEPITIYAFDKSGNISSKNLVAQKNVAVSSGLAPYIFGALILIILLFVAYKIIKRIKK